MLTMSHAQQDFRTFSTESRSLSQADRILELEPTLPVQSVIFRGAGGVDGEVEINVDERGPFEVVYWVVSNRESQGERTARAVGCPLENKRRQTHTAPSFGRDGENKLRGETDGGPGYIGVYFPAIDTSFHHQRFDPETNEIVAGGRGVA